MSRHLPGRAHPDGWWRWATRAPVVERAQRRPDRDDIRVMTSIRAALAVALAATLAALSPGAASAATSTASGHRTLGVSLQSQHWSAKAVTDHEALTGRDVEVVQTFVGWHYPGQPSWSEFPAKQARQIAATGASLEISWDPSSGGSRKDDPRFALAGIASGVHDDYVRRFAQAVRDSQLPVRVRFAQEMNGPWEPWHESRSGNRPGDFARAWRHLHDVFAQEGATNATWVWSPNVVDARSSISPGLYPGDAYVDEVGFDGYSYPKSGCPSPALLFGRTLAQVQAITRKPVRIAETAVATTCPERAAWVTSFFDYLDATPAITGFTWWQRSGDGRDYAVTGGPELAAMRAGLARTEPKTSTPAPAPTPRASVQREPAVERVAGDDRFATAAALSRREHPPGAGTVVVVSGEGFADALAAAPAAKAAAAPILLAGRSGISAATTAEITRLGATRAVVVGGESAVPAVAVAGLRTTGLDVVRTSGADRYATAANLATTLGAASSDREPGVDEVVVASGVAFADGLAGGSYGATVGAPLLLTDPHHLPATVSAALVAVRPRTITLLGGTSAVSAEVEEQIRALGSGQVRRIAGADRYSTALMLQAMAWPRADEVVLASGESFPDALAAGALGRPLALTAATCRPGAVADALEAWSTARLVVVGGAGAVGPGAVRGDACA